MSLRIEVHVQLHIKPMEFFPDALAHFPHGAILSIIPQTVFKCQVQIIDEILYPVFILIVMKFVFNGSEVHGFLDDVEVIGYL